MSTEMVGGKKRPTVQLYRPGMLRAAAQVLKNPDNDSTKQYESNHERPADDCSTRSSSSGTLTNDINRNSSVRCRDVRCESSLGSSKHTPMKSTFDDTRFKGTHMRGSPHSTQRQSHQYSKNNVNSGGGGNGSRFGSNAYPKESATMGEDSHRRLSRDVRHEFDRRRNWSVKSSQSDRWDRRKRLNGRGTGYGVDIYKECGTEVKDAVTAHPASASKHMSFQDLCASFDSIDMESFDWSSEVEAEEQRKRENRLQNTKESSGSLLRLNRATNIKDRGEEVFDQEPKLSFEHGRACRYSGNHTYGSSGRPDMRRLIQRQTFHRSRNESTTSRASVVAESIDDLSSGSGNGFGVKMPKPRWTSSEKRNNPTICYLDEDYPVVFKERTKEGSTSQAQDRPIERTQGGRGNRWRNKLEKAGSSCSGWVNPGPKTRMFGSYAVKAPIVSKEGPRLFRNKSPKVSKGFFPKENVYSHRNRNVEEQHAQKCIRRISELLRQLPASFDSAAGDELLAASESLSQFYTQMLTRDIEHTYSTNLEQRLWLKCFHEPIEALRTASKCSGTGSPSLKRIYLSKLVDQGLNFYAHLINIYEVTFGFVIDDYLYWQEGLPDDDFAGCASIGVDSRIPNDRITKVALLSAHRLALSLGDLYRYDAVLRGNQDCSQAYLWYNRACQLGSANGRTYNQLGLLALYTAKWLDVIFYYVRALTARYPFETAQQPLFSNFNSVQMKVKVYEAEFTARLGKSSAYDAEAAAASADRPHEIWITVDGAPSSGKDTNILYQRAAHFLDSLPSDESLKRMILYIIHAAGLLITKIGMEEYDNISEKAIFQLSHLLSRADCPITSQNLVQISSIFLYAVHTSSLLESEPGNCSLQLQLAVQMVISIFGVLLELVKEHLDELESILGGTSEVPTKMRLVMPATFIISEWLSTPSINHLYINMPSLDSLQTDLIRIDTWNTLANVANALVAAESQDLLLRNIPHTEEHSEDFVEIVLPEGVFLSSFVDVFPITPKTVTMPSPTNVNIKQNSNLLALHARLSLILSTCEFLDGSELPCFHFDEHSQQFIANKCVLSPVSSQRTPEALPEIEQVEEKSTADNDLWNSVENLSEEELYRKTRRENELKKKLLEKELNEGRPVIEVRPEYLAPDTNAFIDYLESIIKIVKSGRFKILVSTTVYSELKKLSQPALSSNNATMGALLNNQNGDWVGERAKQAVEFLDVAAKYTSMFALTSKGNKVSMQFRSEDFRTQSNEELVNDDLILESCSAFNEKLPSASSAGSCNPSRICRQIVLLTEDRTLNIKAACASIPCMTVPSFFKWAKFT